MKFKRHLLYIFIISISILFTACGAHKIRYYDNMTKYIQDGDYEQAYNQAEISKQKVYGNKNALLYYLDKGYLLHLMGEYTESNIAFEEAKKIADKYFTKSITTEASTLLISDNTRPYYGENFERALIHTFSALNYIFLDNEPSALVEARQVDHFLTTLQTNYGHKNKYKEDAFSRYIMGMIYENQGDINNAYISYYKALQAYANQRDIYQVKTPKMLLEDAIRTATKLGFKDEIKNIKNNWGKNFDYKEHPKSYGELIIFHYNGVCPEKIENIFEISFGNAWAYVGSYDVKGDEEKEVEQAESIARNLFADDQVRIAFPKYSDVPYYIKDMYASVPVSSDNEIETKSIMVENIGALAKDSLNERINKIRGRAIARAAIKYALANEASKQVKKESNDEVLAWFTKKILTTVSNLTEQADRRSWRSLPDQISMAKIYLPQGTYDITLTFTDSQGNVVEEQILETQVINPRKKTFAVVRTAL